MDESTALSCMYAAYGTIGKRIEMKIARVFPTKTSYSPIDEHAYFHEPDMFTPNYDEIHISCTFTWDIDKAYRLAKAWECKGNVKVGGVAIDGESDKPFVSGMYLKKGITITSRGCPNNCSFCMVRRGLIEFDDFPEGHIVNDNNFLACSDKHRNLVYKMLKNQKKIEFKGGLEARRITPKIAEDLRGLNIEALWLACDRDTAIKPLKRAVDILKKVGFKNRNLYCYVLIGKEELRLRAVREMGVMPYAQLYQAPNKTKTEYTKEMKQYQRLMARPPLTRNIFKDLIEVK